MTCKRSLVQVQYRPPFYFNRNKGLSTKWINPCSLSGGLVTVSIMAEGGRFELHAVSCTTGLDPAAGRITFVRSPPAQFAITRRGEMTEDEGIEPCAVASAACSVFLLRRAASARSSPAHRIKWQRARESNPMRFPAYEAWRLRCLPTALTPCKSGIRLFPFTRHGERAEGEGIEP